MKNDSEQVNDRPYIEIEKEEVIETYKSLITISLEGLKFLSLLNGGAAVAILAFLGQVYSKGGSVPYMTLPMLSFIIGLFCNGLSFLFVYFTQLRVYEGALQEAPIFNSRSWKMMARFALSFAFVSLCSFSVGCFLAVNLFQR